MWRHRAVTLTVYASKDGFQVVITGLALRELPTIMFWEKNPLFYARETTTIAREHFLELI